MVWVSPSTPIGSQSAPAEMVPGDRHLGDLRPELAEKLGGLPHLVVDAALRLRMTEALLHHARSGGLRRRRSSDSRVRVHLGRVLARIVAVGAGDHLEQQRIVLDGGRHRPGVVDVDLDRHDAGVGHQAVGRLHAVDPAERRGHADRAALVAADRHVGLAQGDQHRAARRRAAGRVAPLVRVVHRAGGVGVAAAGQAEVLAVRLAEDGAAGVEDAGTMVASISGM